MRRSLLALACVLLVVLAGCAAPTTDDAPTSDVQLSIDNSDTIPYEVTISVVPSTIETLRITDADGTTQTYHNVSSLGSVPSEVLGSAVGFTATGPNVTTKSYILDPQTGIGDTLRETPRNATVVFLITKPERAEPTRSWGTLTCGDIEFAAIDVRIANGGALSVANHCGSTSPTQ